MVLEFEFQGQYDTQWVVIESIAAKIGCTDEQRRIKELEREVRELRQTNEILSLVGAYFPA